MHKEKITIEEIQSIESNPSNEYHILRHFSDIDSQYIETLLGKAYRFFDYGIKRFTTGIISQYDIDMALETKGGSFFPSVPGLESPRKVIELIKKEFLRCVEQNELERNVDGEDKKIEISFEHKTYVGEENVMFIDQLTKEQRSKIKRIPRSSHPNEKDCIINTLTGIEKKKTKYISAAIHITPELPFTFVTAFPRGHGATKETGQLSEFDDLVFLL